MKLGMLALAPLLVSGCGSVPAGDGKEPTEDDGGDGTDHSGGGGDPDPYDLDSDGDGLSDGLEGELGTDPDVADTDGDGLADGDEVELGLDPNAADTDGDGYSDGAELDANTNPSDPDDKPYAGGWTKDACRNDIEGTGYGVGDIAEDWTLPDQFGEQVRLHDFCDHVVYLVFAAFW